MASPYFTPIQHTRSDFSGIVQAGITQGNTYANLGRIIGNTITEVGNMYFEDKKLGRSFSDFLKTEEGEKYAIDEMGYTPEQVAKWRENPALIDKEVKQTFADLGGTREIRKSIQQKTEFDLRMQREKELLENSKTQGELLDMQVAQAKDLQGELDANKEIYKHYYRQNPDGSIAMNLDGYSKMQEHGRFINKLSRSGAIRGFSAANFSEYLKSNKGADITDVQGLKSLATEYAAVTNAPQSDVKLFMEQAEQMSISPKEIQETAEAKIYDTDPIMKSRMETVGRFGELMASYDNAVGYKIGADGKREAYIKNPASANMLQRAMAKIGNGGGNMTDEDVKAISGATDYKSQWRRVYDKFMPADGDAAATSLTAEDIEFIGDAGRAIFDFSKEYVDTGVKQGLEATRSAYSDRLSMPQVVKHSGFQKYLGFDSGGVDIRSGNIRAATEDDMMLGSAVSSSDTARAIARVFEDGDMTMGQMEELLHAENPEMTIDDIRAKINFSLNFVKEAKQRDEAGDTPDQTDTEDDPDAQKSAADIVGGFEQFEPEYDSLMRDASVAGGTGLALQAAQRPLGNRFAVKNPLSKTSGLPKSVGEKVFGEGSAKAQYLRGNPLAVKSLESAKTADMTKLKKLAKNHGITDLSKYTGADGEAKLRKKVASAIRKDITSKVSTWAAKKGIRTGLKRIALSALGGFVTGGISTAVGLGSLAYDIFTLAEQNADMQIEQYDEKLADPEIPESIKKELRKLRSDFIKQSERDPTSYENRYYFGKK